jgi:hypothetical protein
MAPIPSVYLTAADGVTSLIGCTNAGQLQSFPQSPGTAGVNGIPISDSSSAQLWNLIIFGAGDPRGPAGQLHLDPITGPAAPMQIPLVAPNGTIFAIIANSAVPQVLQTIMAPGQCPFSLGDLDTALAMRLYDVTGQFWPQAERFLYINEALRTWNALTGYWRGDFTFQLQSGTQWYDITDQVAMPNTLRPLTVTSAQLLTLLEYHLLEPPVGAGAWTGSAQFTLADLQTALQRRRNECVGLSGCSITRLLMPTAAIRTALPSTVIDVRRIAYIPADGAPTVVLWPDDSWAEEQFDDGYTTRVAGVPSVYSLSTEPWLTFDVDVLPLPGQFEVLVVLSTAPGETAEPGNTPQIVPDDWTWVLKWGALSDVLGRESNAKDIPRQQYCEQRYRAGMKLLSMAPAVVAARINNIPLQIDAVKSADEFDTTWQAQSPTLPTQLLTAGLNLIAAAPAPDAGPYSITLTVVENAPLPTQPTDCLMLDRSLFDVILDYAQHLAAFKMGGAEFSATEAHLTRFMQAAALYTSKLQGMGEYSEVLFKLSQREEQQNPRYKLGSGLEAEQ